jgi:PTH1 family peptidyl-tRNA hydrolase
MDIFKIFEQLKTSHSDTKPGTNFNTLTHIIVGLGNPGIQYMNTRHNVGFMAADRIVSVAGGSFEKLRFKANTADINLEGRRVLVLKPVTFMNNSGEAVAEAMHFYKIKSDHVLVISDDIYLEPGLIRIRRKGTHGGHNGFRSIFELTGEEDFPRIKIGVGRKPEGYDLADWVLSRFTDNEKKSVETAVENAAEAAKLIVNDSIDKAMNKFSK